MKLLLFLLLSCQMSFAQSQAGELKGVVVNENGEAIPFARVLVYAFSEKDGKLMSGAETDFDGEFRITNLQPGEYEIIFDAYFDGVDTLRLTNVRIYPEQITSLGEVTMYPSHQEIISCDFGMELRPAIKLDPFGGPTIIKKEEIRRP